MNMKRILTTLAAIIVASVSAFAQETMAEDLSGWANEWKYAFSKEGMKEWKPEFTLRESGGFFTGRRMLTGGVRVDEKRSFAWRADVLDELNAELQIREDLKNSGLKGNYYIADAKEVEGRKFIKQGSETVNTKYGSFNTIKVVMKHSKPGRETIFWLAPKLDYLPVKVSHVDKKTSYGLLLTDYKGAGN